MGDSKRQQILHHTLDYFKKHPELEQIAINNMKSWPVQECEKTVICMSGDTLDTTRQLTKKYGVKCLVLNMASCKAFGGGYQKGRSAQEENIFRRTNAHFTRISGGFYTKKESDAIQGFNGVFPTYPLICIKGPEIGLDGDGYEMLDDTDIFPFIEMRSAAVKAAYCSKTQAQNQMKKRIDTQFKTAIVGGYRHIVLGAFGCGAFRNDPEMVANLYLKALETYKGNFELVAFPIYYAGLGKDNLEVFQKVFRMGLSRDSFRYRESIPKDI